MDINAPEPTYTVLVFHPDAGMPGNMLPVRWAPADAHHFLSHIEDDDGFFRTIELADIPGVADGGAVRVSSAALRRVVMIGEGTVKKTAPGGPRVLPVGADGFPPGFLPS